MKVQEHKYKVAVKTHYIMLWKTILTIENEQTYTHLKCPFLQFAFQFVLWSNVAVCVHVDEINNAGLGPVSGIFGNSTRTLSDKS